MPLIDSPKAKPFLPYFTNPVTWGRRAFHADVDLATTKIMSTWAYFHLLFAIDKTLKFRFMILINSHWFDYSFPLFLPLVVDRFVS
jgi:hypothetical protein